MSKNKFLLLLALGFLLVGALTSSGKFKVNLPQITLPSQLQQLLSKPATDNTGFTSFLGEEKVKITSEESVVIDAVDKVSPAVVTVGITTTRKSSDLFEINPFDPFSPFRRTPGSTQKIEQDIGTGFIVSPDGIIVTNKHVVGVSDAKYRVITKDDKTYEVEKIYRDPVNDLAIVKINATGLPTVELGDSTKIRVGQLAIAIGTALGEFRHTVTTGVISGMGRGITAGSPFEGAAERLDNVIQTDAAINPGNSGGPLINSSGQVIGVNTAVSAEGQNIGFALPINVVKEALDNFNRTGQFNRPYLGIRYKVVTKDVAILNDIPEGAYIIEVVTGSPAKKADLLEGDIVTKIDSTRLSGQNAELAKVISSKKAGDTVGLTVYRDNKELSLTATLGTQN